MSRRAIPTISPEERRAVPDRRKAEALAQELGALEGTLPGIAARIEQTDPDLLREAISDRAAAFGDDTGALIEQLLHAADALRAIFPPEAEGEAGTR